MKYPFYTLLKYDPFTSALQVVQTERPRESEIQNSELIIHQTGDEKTTILKNRWGWQDIGHKWNMIYGE